MSEQKFKVVRCLKHIPEKLWGRVVEDGFLQTRFNKFMGYDLKEFNLKQSDTFPLPEQGDKVEQSDDGIKWFGFKERDDWRFTCYQQGHKEPFRFELLNDEPSVYRAKYIRPIEAKECKPTLSTMPFEPLMQKYDTKLRNGQLYFVASGYVMMREDAQRICDELNRMLKEFKDE